MAGGLWRAGSPELLAATADLHRLACRVDAVMHALVRDIDVPGGSDRGRRGQHRCLVAVPAADAPGRW